MHIEELKEVLIRGARYVQCTPCMSQTAPLNPLQLIPDRAQEVLAVLNVFLGLDPLR